MKLEYDPAKNARNLHERGLSFEQAREFHIASARIWKDLRHSYPEPRFIAQGMLAGRLHVLCFTRIKGGIRVISFRKANRREIKAYENARTTDSTD